MFKSWCIQVVFVHVNMCATVCVSKLFFCVRGYVILLIDFLLYICWQQLHLYHLYELYKSLSWKMFYLSIPFDLRISLFWPFLILLAIVVICNLKYIGIKTNCLKSRMVCYALESFMFFSYIADSLNFPATHTFPWCWHHLTLRTLAPIWCIKTTIPVIYIYMYAVKCINRTARESISIQKHRQ